MGMKLLGNQDPDLCRVVDETREVRETAIELPSTLGYQTLDGENGARALHEPIPHSEWLTLSCMDDAKSEVLTDANHDVLAEPNAVEPVAGRVRAALDQVHGEQRVRT
jgi:hypothetical protein